MVVGDELLDIVGAAAAILRPVGRSHVISHRGAHGGVDQGVFGVSERGRGDTATGNGVASQEQSTTLA